jgi:hypothetical protein
MGHHQPTRTASDDCQLNHAHPRTECYALKKMTPISYNTRY